MRLFSGKSSIYSDGGITVTWPVEWKGKKYQVIYSFDGVDENVDIGVEPMVALFAQAAILNNFTLTSDEPISAVFHDNMTRGLVDLWKWWQPDKQWNLTLDMPTKNDGSTVSTAKANQGVMSSFSGGVDSFHTLFSHHDEITHLLFLSGYDVTYKPLMDTVMPKIRAVADLYQKQLVVVSTNVRTLFPELKFDKPLDWLNHLHGPAAFSVVKSLAPCAGAKFYFPSTTKKSEESLQIASGYRMDHLFGNQQQQFIHDGDYSRPEKIDFICRHDLPTVLTFLRVCYTNNFQRNSAYNCEVCEKCVRTQLMLQILGHLTEPCPAFPNWTAKANIADLVQRQIRDAKNPLVVTLWKEVESLIKVTQK